MNQRDSDINITRAPKDRDNPYGMLRRATFDGSPLTFEERGILAYILMKPDGWKANIKDLMREGGIGRDKTYGIINGLISKGYAKREEHRHKGKFLAATIHFFEQPLPEKPDTAQPDTAQPDTAQPDTENQEHINKGLVPITDPLLITEQTKVATPPLPAAKAPPPKATAKKSSGETSFVQENLGLTDDVDMPPPNTLCAPPPAARPLTPQQEMFGAICEAIGWDYHIISEESKKQVSQAGGILRKAGYTVDDIRTFMLDKWFADWLWTKHGKRPTLEQLRQGLGNLRAGIPEGIGNHQSGAVFDKNQAAADRVRARLIAEGKEHLLR